MRYIIATGVAAAAIAVAAAAMIGEPGKAGAIEAPMILTSSQDTTEPAISPTPAAMTTALISDADLIRHDIAPVDVDPFAVQAPNKHTGLPNENIVLVPDRPKDRKKELFLYVVGTNVSTSTQQEILYAGARRGYHVISLAYPNYDAVVPLCAGSLDDDCTGKVREEILTGVDKTPKVAISPQDALETRLVNLLSYLQSQYPSEDWGKFVQRGAIDWPLIKAVGHSQGAGHVAMLAKRHALSRATMISGVADLATTGQPAPWLSAPGLTPANRMYGFTHVADYVVPVVLAEASWDAMGLGAFGPLTSVDGQAADYGGSHKLLTALVPEAGANPHIAMVEDSKMPRADDGSPAHLPVWELIAFP